MRLAHSLGANTAETTYYTPLANLFNAIGQTLKPRVVFQAHPGSHGAGLADGGFFPVVRNTQQEPLPNQRPERGAVEIKPPDANMASLANSAQVRRYLETYGLCLITNYHQFQLLELRHSEPRAIEAYELAHTAGAFWNLPAGELASQHSETLPDFLLRVMTRKVPLERPKDVAWLLASYAREGRARAATHPLAAFANVKSALQESLGITFEGEKGEHFFLSTLIQTLFYGIFSAWILWRRTPEAREPNAAFNWRLSATYLRIPVLRSLFHAISEPGALNTVQITEVLDHANDAINRIQPTFFTTFNDEDAVNYFYEPFLEAFDPELRKQLGVWYTPRDIVRYMVERVDHLLRTELTDPDHPETSLAPLGLASPNVQVLDPCCGTGAYLVEVLHRIERTLREQAGEDDAFIGSDLRQAATTRIFGFEVMPAPFVIAHLQVANMLEKTGASLADTQRARVYLTNALTGWIPVEHPKTAFWPDFVQERDDAEAIKQADRILVILGNPPYNGYAGIARIDEERDLTSTYSMPVDGLPRPQGQGLNDLYIRFFRIAERRITHNRDHRGIVCFISNYSWLDGLSHTTMRHHFAKTFDEIYIDNLHGDRRISEYAPDGRTSETVFAMQGSSVGIKVGTAIATLVKKGKQPIASTISYRDFEDARAEERRLHLLESLHGGDAYCALEPNRTLGMPLKPREFTTTYLAWPKLPELFPISFPGVKTSRDSLLVDTDYDSLKKRMSKYLDRSVSNEKMAAVLPSAMGNTPRFPASLTRGYLQERNYDTAAPERHWPMHAWKIVRYGYRPFDVRWLYWEPETKLLDEKRAEYMGTVIFPAPTLALQQKSRGESSPPQVTTAIGCLDLLDRGATYFPMHTLKLPSDPTKPIYSEANIAMLAVEWARRLGADDGKLFFHALATTHTPRYRRENAGALLGDWPRIPLPSRAELLTHSASLGQRLAQLLDPEASVQLAGEWSFLAKLSLPRESSEDKPDRDQLNAKRLALTAGWGGPGQGGTVMPRRGKAPERDWTETELERIATLAGTQAITRDQALELLGERCVDVYLNSDAFWGAVPLRVWEYSLGGYQVLKKWLSYREAPLLGRPLHEDEARYFAQIVRRIAAILLIGPALDASYSAILPGATGLPTRN